MTREIPLSQGKVAIVDDADFEWLSQWKWSYVQTKQGNEYALRKAGKNKTVLMHRAILNPADGYQADHIDGNGLNNTRGNLRECTASQNCQNKPRRRDSQWPYKGISYHDGKWYATIRADGEVLHLGSHNTPEAAALAYDEAARKYFGEFAKLNFPDRSICFIDQYRDRLADLRAELKARRQQTHQRKHIASEIKRRLLAGEPPLSIAADLNVHRMRVYKAHERLRRNNQEA